MNVLQCHHGGNACKTDLRGPIRFRASFFLLWCFGGQCYKAIFINGGPISDRETVKAEETAGQKTVLDAQKHNMGAKILLEVEGHT
jgi:hypothetical protein